MGRFAGAKFSLTVLGELRHRGVHDTFIVCCHGLKGLPDSISAEALKRRGSRSGPPLGIHGRRLDRVRFDKRRTRRLQTGIVSSTAPVHPDPATPTRPRNRTRPTPPRPDPRRSPRRHRQPATQHARMTPAREPRITRVTTLRDARLPARGARVRRYWRMASPVARGWPLVHSTGDIALRGLASIINVPTDSVRGRGPIRRG